MPDPTHATAVAARTAPPPKQGVSSPAAADPLPLPAVGTATDPAVAKLRLFTVVAVVAFFFAGVPALNAAGAIDDYKVQILGRYLCFALVALGLDLVWGYTGMLSLCQALFFCLGGYAMAMHLALPEGGGDVRPEYNNIPQFMFFNNLTELPGFWRPFGSLAAAVGLGLALAAAAATVFGFFIFRSRVRGVYFSIVTQAVAWGAWLLICQNEMLLGGTNGLTNFSKAFGQERKWIVGLYLATCALVVLGYLVCRWVVRSRAGRVMVAIRDKEMRLYFAGYKPYAFKVFVFAVAGAIGAAGGMLYPAQMGIITPQNMNVEASIFVVIMVAVGGRGRLWGAVFGAVLVATARGALSSDLPTVWPFVYGLVFIAVVLFFPDGFVGLWDDVEKAVANRESAGRVAVAAMPVALAALFALPEVLGLMPAALQQELAVNVPRGQFVLLLIAVLGAFIWIGLSMTKSDLSARQAAVISILAGLCGLVGLVFAAMYVTGPIVVVLRVKYQLLMAGIAAAIALRVITKARSAPGAARGFAVTPAAAGGAGR
ncbi:MAG TPA: urea ABC transporter permease subunit UrtC [Humisphaera sp.]